MTEAELDELIKRLRTVHKFAGWSQLLNPDGCAGANAITALRAENARMRTALDWALQQAKGNVHHHLIATAITTALEDSK